jgi:hypothetical protein
VNRTFIVNTNPIAPIACWEISPCAKTPDTEGGYAVEAFETMAEARSAVDRLGGTTFWGVYARLSDDAIAAALGPPVIQVYHLKDFDSYDEAVRLVQLFNGVNDDD